MKLCLAVVLSLVAVGCHGRGISHTSGPVVPGTAVRVAELENRLVERFSTLQAPGTVYGLYHGEDLEPVIELELGYADENKSRRITADDHFRIASVTKMFVGTVVLQLADEGKLELDAPVGRYVTGVPNGDQITIAMLGYHTSGLPRVIANPDYQKAIVDRPGYQWRTEQTLRYAWSMDSLFPPGEGWMYSNTNTIVLGQVIEAVTGNKWHDEVDRRICKPLKLEHTGYPVNSVVPTPTPRGYRFGVKENLIKYGDYWFDATGWSASWAGAAGDMYSTRGDLARFTRAAARGELVSERPRPILFSYIDTGYEDIEYGFHIARRRGIIGSTGDVPGFSVFVGYEPRLDLTIISLSNLTATSDKLTAAAELGELTGEKIKR